MYNAGLWGKTRVQPGGLYAAAKGLGGGNRFGKQELGGMEECKS
jgi:hypothetical protein